MAFLPIIILPELMKNVMYKRSIDMKKEITLHNIIAVVAMLIAVVVICFQMVVSTPARDGGMADNNKKGTLEFCGGTEGIADVACGR